jgi:hypothetical protein
MPRLIPSLALAAAVVISVLAWGPTTSAQGQDRPARDPFGNP